MWMTSCTGSVRGWFWRFEKKSVSWVLASEEDGWLSGLAEDLRRGPHVVGGRWKSQHRKIVYHSPYVEKPFNSKVIKSFVPELRSRKMLYFGFPMYISHIRISGYVTLFVWNWLKNCQRYVCSKLFSRVPNHWYSAPWLLQVKMSYKIFWTGFKSSWYRMILCKWIWLFY